MIRILPSFVGALAACTPSPQEIAIPDLGQSSAPDIEGPGVPPQRAGDPQRAAPGPIPEPVSAAENLAPALPADSPEEALGRRTLSTAFVMAGPDRRLTVELHDGRVLVLRDMVMRPADYCGMPMLGDGAGGRYCGTYGEVAAARPGGPPAVERDLAAANPLESPRSPAVRR